MSPRRSGHAKKYAPHARPAVAAGSPVAVVDALIEVAGIDEEDLTFDTLLFTDLGLDDLDVVEVAMALHVDDDRLIDDGTRVSDLVAAYKRAEDRR